MIHLRKNQEEDVQDSLDMKQIMLDLDEGSYG